MAAGPSCVGDFLIDLTCLGVLQCPMGTHHAEPSSCSSLLNLRILPSASAGIRTGPIAGNEVLRANDKHEAPATHGSDASTSHPSPCVWASLASSPGCGLCLEP